MNLHDELRPVMAELGFELRNKQFHGRSGTVPMTVWFNPENRLKRIRTISLDCGMPGDTEVTGEPLYVFDQASAASGDWRRAYRPDSPGWPGVLVADFERVTVPFIRRATSGEAILELLLAGDAPPQHGPASTGVPMFAVRMARRLGLPQYEQRAVALVERQRYDLSEYREIRDWARREGLQPRLRLPRPWRQRGIR